MRLVCPNCSAEYEVDASVIPSAGRDVQCSNCGHGWFQGPPGAERTPPLPAADQHDSGERPRPARSRVAIQRTSRPADSTESPRAASTSTPSDLSSDLPMPNLPHLAQPRRKVDEQVLRVLRAEAEREEKMRRGEAVEDFYPQAELPLDGAAPRQSMRIPSDPRDLPDEELLPSGTIGRRRKPAGKTVLPDIEEINSSLRASSERADSVPAYVEIDQRLKRVRRGQGFRLGFGLVLLGMAIALIGYVFAPEIAARFPETVTYLEVYVTEVNKLRVMLDSAVRDGIAWLSRIVAENSGGA